MTTSPCKPNTWFKAASIAALVLTGGGQAPRAADDPAVVMTDKGAVRGVVKDGLREFKGIPYAAPPVGDLRWSSPQPAKSWQDVRDATRYGAACAQVSRYGLTEASDSEDCLTVNVTAPYAGPEDLNRKRPVIVWIHGGAFVRGSSALYPLGYMAKSGDAVVVSLNYRLGVFGFLAHPSFDADRNGGYALEDQRLALRWVKDNIAKFGGDPDNVTLAGESAGAGSVCMHLISPKETKDLFDKAIVQSAGCAQPMHTVAEASRIGQKVAELVGCTDPATALSCMRSKPVNDLLDAASKASDGDLTAYEPVVGTRTLPLQGQEALSTGQFVKVPIILGGTRDEMRLYVAYDVQAGASITKDNYADRLKAVYGENAPAVLKQYPLTPYSQPPALLGTVMSDFNPAIGLNNCIYLQTGKLMRKSVPVYQYVFADRTAPDVTENPGFEMGAVHSSELPYQFPHYDNTTKLAGQDLTPAQQKLADTMMALWTSFAKSGKPVASGSPAWPLFTSDSSVMRFDAGRAELFDAAVAHNCGFWKTLYPSILTE